MSLVIVSHGQPRPLATVLVTTPCSTSLPCPFTSPHSCHCLSRSPHPVLIPGLLSGVTSSYARYSRLVPWNALFTRGERRFFAGCSQARETGRQKKRNGKEKERVKVALLSGMHRSRTRCSTRGRKRGKRENGTRGKWEERVVVFSIQLSTTAFKKGWKLNDRKKGRQVEDGR